MLQNDFFTFTALQTEGDLLKTTIGLNAMHPIFKGHFPEQPIVPGVCMLQMVKEVTAVYLQKQIRLSKAAELKFLSFIDPNQNPFVKMELKISNFDDQLKVEARLLTDEKVLFKFKGVFLPI